MSTPKKIRFLRQLAMYRCYVSEHDVHLHYRYQEFLKALNIAPDQEKAPLAWRTTYDGSAFREMMYVDIYDHLHALLKVGDRYTHHYMAGHLRIEVHLYEDSFNILFNPMMFHEAPLKQEKYFKRIWKELYKEDRKVMLECIRDKTKTIKVPF